ncbi:MAG TPA: hypothetical protein PLJ12_11475, partial [Planctomycetota bacterium]|nr:hypothetical protein [Planctomycetota bacterium]
QTIVHGRFSSYPSIWMGFALIYLGLGTGAMFATIFAVSQWMIGRPPNALWALPLCLGLAASLWLATRIGQGLAAKDMADLRQAVEESLQRPTFDPEP